MKNKTQKTKKINSPALESLSAPISIKVNNLSKKLKTTQALMNVSLNFEEAKMHGVIGPEGSGKTTLMRIIAGLLKPNEGEVEYFQNNAKILFEQIRAKIAYMPQTPSLYSDLSIEEHLIFFKTLYQLSSTDYETRKKELLTITQLEPFVNRPAGQLSGGMYKKLGLICALLRAPEIMLLDEPTTGVDPISRREFWDLLYRILDRKILIIVTTAYMDEAERCSMVHLMSAGKTIAEGEPKKLLEDEQVPSFDQLFVKYGNMKNGNMKNGNPQK